MSEPVNGAGLVRRRQRYSVSVSRRTYERLRAAVPGSLAKFVDEIVAAALTDPSAKERLAARCRGGRRGCT